MYDGATTKTLRLEGGGGVGGTHTATAGEFIGLSPHRGRIDALGVHNRHSSVTRADDGPC